jgi:putative oxidoreductase
MGMMHKLENWSTTHHPRWLVLPRVALGISLFVKGISFLNNTVMVESLLKESNMNIGANWLPLAITWLHLICGTLICIGLLTRWAALVMIPILLVAVFFVNAPRGIFTPDSEFAFSFIVWLMLVFFFLEGGGPLSLDEFFRKNPK